MDKLLKKYEYARNIDFDDILICLEKIINVIVLEAIQQVIYIDKNNRMKRTNKIKCRKCGDIIESIDVHDFKCCSCGEVAIDGGREYLRRVGNKDDFEELSHFIKL